MMLTRLSWLSLIGLFLSCSTGQQIGSPNKHPGFKTQKCSKHSGCVVQDTSVVLDIGRHPMTTSGSNQSCLSSDGTLNQNSCPDATTCLHKCVVQGIDDYTKHGVSTDGDTMTLQMYVNSEVQSPRVYLLDADGKDYVNVQLLNQEFAFTVDTSDLPCGMNGALYLTSMDPTGGRSDLNPAGATYGHGYGDAQCNPQPFINGVPNLDKSGACANEMDIWEANARATSYTPHTCSKDGLYKCNGDECGESGVCDKPGCGFNPYKLGVKDFYGSKVDTSKPFTVITQFPTDDGSPDGILKEIKRFYVQDGDVIPNAKVHYQNVTTDSITDSFCSASATKFRERGGMARMGETLAEGMVLIWSVWNDNTAFMNWLDSGEAGPCDSTEGDPKLILQKNPDTSVTFKDIRWGDIGSTYPDLKLSSPGRRFA